MANAPYNAPYTLVRGNGTTTVNWSPETRESLLQMLEYQPDRDQALDFIESPIVRSGSFVVLPSTGWLLVCTAPYAERDPAAATGLTNALLVMLCTTHIRAYLEREDPKALEQARNALRAVGEL